MGTRAVRRAGLLAALWALLAVSAPSALGATPKEIDRAIQKGAAALKDRYAKGGPPAGTGVENAAGIGPTCLAGLAVLEAGTPVNDPAVKAVTDLVRGAAYTQTRTYQVALCLMYLSRLDDPADVPLVQMLAVRLLVGQTASGGWGYECCGQVPPATAEWLRATLKPAQLVGGGAGQAPKLHPDVEKYRQALVAARGQPNGAGAGEDNSNTQFAVIAVWMARKHGAPVDGALDLIEKRFMGSQDRASGNWAYSGLSTTGGSPSMYCAGLLGMATAVARREERRAKPPPKPAVLATAGKPADPFYNPPPPKEPAKKPAHPADERDHVVQRALAGLDLTIDAQLRSGKGLLFAETTGHGTGDLYFLWSLERVGVTYGLDKIGRCDWYDAGSTALVRAQGADGHWNVGGSYGTEVNTAFAILFLCRSNLARDLSNKVQGGPTSAELRAGGGQTATDLVPNRPAAQAGGPVPDLPNPQGDAAVALASKLLRSSPGDWAKALAEARDAKDPTSTRVLVVTATHADGDRKLAAREALAERLCRMTPATLRAMLKAGEPELRRAAALACAMKDDKDHVPDLIAALTDADDAVTRAAKSGLKSLTGKDFGPPAAATPEQKAAAASAWRDWAAKEKK